MSNGLQPDLQGKLVVVDTEAAFVQDLVRFLNNRARAGTYIRVSAIIRNGMVERVTVEREYDVKR